MPEPERAQPPTYADLFDCYASGQMSTTVMVEMLRTDEVFAAYCKRRVRLIREYLKKPAREACPRWMDEDPI